MLSCSGRSWSSNYLRFLLCVFSTILLLILKSRRVCLVFTFFCELKIQMIIVVQQIYEYLIADYFNNIFLKFDSICVHSFCCDGHCGLFDYLFFFHSFFMKIYEKLIDVLNRFLLLILLFFGESKYIL